MLAGSGDGAGHAAEPPASGAPSLPAPVTGQMGGIEGPESPTLSWRPSQPPSLESSSPGGTPRHYGGLCGAGADDQWALNPAAAPWRPGGGSEVAAEQADACPACAPLVQRQAVRLACLEEKLERQALLIERQAAELQKYRAAELVLDCAAELTQDSAGSVTGAAAAAAAGTPAGAVDGSGELSCKLATQALSEVAGVLAACRATGKRGVDPKQLTQKAKDGLRALCSTLAKWHRATFLRQRIPSQEEAAQLLASVGWRLDEEGPELVELGAAAAVRWELGTVVNPAVWVEYVAGVVRRAITEGEPGTGLRCTRHLGVAHLLMAGIKGSGHRVTPEQALALLVCAVETGLQPYQLESAQRTCSGAWDDCAMAVQSMVAPSETMKKQAVLCLMQEILNPDMTTDEYKAQLELFCRTVTEDSAGKLARTPASILWSHMLRFTIWQCFSLDIGGHRKWHKDVHQQSQAFRVSCLSSNNHRQGYCIEGYVAQGPGAVATVHSAFVRNVLVPLAHAFEVLAPSLTEATHNVIKILNHYDTSGAAQPQP
eukprot:TRINITY_DN18103_c0_g1_i12.p1 TRINITY_DN18103_c0_g1~~TRINITY_DN18103_c0_g1_i12.p1  ORF type:complete len:543 (+),score=126.18 TRINITY_DN18103_c0_g1_i12:68-1696(+)